MSGGSFLVLRTSQCQARPPRCRFAGFATTVLRKQSDGGWEAPIREFSPIRELTGRFRVRRDPGGTLHCAGPIDKHFETAQNPFPKMSF
jgi:hypothetical protein